MSGAIKKLAHPSETGHSRSQTGELIFAAKGGKEKLNTAYISVRSRYFFNSPLTPLTAAVTTELDEHTVTAHRCVLNAVGSNNALQ